MNLFRYALPIIFAAPFVKAVDTNNLKFVSVDACKTYYTNSVGSASGQTADGYCQDKIMTAIEACVQTKINTYLTANKFSAITDMINSEQISLKSKSQYDCQAENQKSVASAAQAAQQKSASSSSTSTATTAAAVAAAAAAAAAGSNSNNSSATQAASQIAQQLAKTSGGAGQAANAVGNAQKAFEQVGTDGVAKAAGDAIKQANQNIQNGISVTPLNPMTDAERVSADAKSAFRNSEITSQNQAEAAAKADPYSADYVSAADAQNDAATAQNKIAAAAQEAKAQVSQAGEAIQKAEDAAKVPSTTPGNQTAITAASKKASATLNQNVVDAISPSATTLQTPSPAQAYALTLNTLKQIQTDIQTYTTTPKESCTNMAEKASLLCVEGTSPGAVAAKGVMDAAGPVLAIISSAQKTCSSTAKVTQVVNMGLTIAKGVCIAAKLTCDQSCGTAVTKLTQLNASIQSQLTSAITNDWSNAEAQCHTQAGVVASPCSASGTYKACYDAYYNPCTADNSKKRTEASALIGKLQTVVKSENTPTTPGTSPSIAAGCQNHMNDIALFAVQLLGTAAAQKSAKACAEKLESSTAGSAVTTQQYCEKPANVNEQICVCQKNSMASGCPGAIAASIGSTNDLGTNIKSAQGNSAFAGGFGTTPTNALGGVGLNGGAVKDGISGKGSSAADAGAGSGFAGGAAAGTGSGVSAPGSSAEDPSGKKPEENKKWSFGAFSGMGGGVAGLFGSGSGGKGEKSGALNEKDLNAVKRQIASERISAEVSSASGKSNWEKVRNMYLIKEASFLGQ